MVKYYFPIHYLDHHYHFNQGELDIGIHNILITHYIYYNLPLHVIFPNQLNTRIFTPSKTPLNANCTYFQHNSLICFDQIQ